jgi:hypothetical protein
MASKAAIETMIAMAVVHVSDYFEYRSVKTVTARLSASKRIVDATKSYISDDMGKDDYHAMIANAI